MMLKTSVLIATYSCPKCGSLKTTRLQERQKPCQRIRCQECGYEGSPFAEFEDDWTPENDISGYEWTCPSCGHHGYRLKTAYEVSEDHPGLGMATVYVCTCCGYEL